MKSKTHQEIERELENDLPVETKLSLLNDLAFSCKERSKYEEVKSISEQILTILESYPNDLEHGRILNTLGLMYLDNGDFVLSCTTLHQAISIFTNIDNQEFLSVALCNIGAAYRSRGKFQKAIEYLQESITIAEKYSFEKVIVGSFINIGNAYRNLKQYPLAIEYYNKSLSTSRKINYLNGIANSLGNLGNVHSNLLEYDTALQFHFQSLEISQILEDLTGISIDLGNIGTIYLELKDYPKAIEFFLQSLNIAEQLGNNNSAAIKLINLGVVYGSLDFVGSDVIKALEYLERGLQIAIESDDKKIQSITHQNIAEILKREKKWEEYSYHFEKFHEIHSELNDTKVKEFVQQFNLERNEAEREKELAIERATAEERTKILEDILPKEILHRLIQGETKIANYLENVGILFVDIVGFTQLSESISPNELVDCLDIVFSHFDIICQRNSIEKIKTIGDAYFAVAGATLNINNPCFHLAIAALEMLEIAKYLPTLLNNRPLDFRIGLHVGEVVAGIIGKNKFTFDLWGDAVNIASRMESSSEPGKIQISEIFANSIKDCSEFNIIPRGEINIKGKGTMNTFWLEKA
ncbi:MAG: tetratricopeptide repeat protein [Candidatus Kapabacteria bacterium]|nr:tetratricopeptide repeat protein [Candidatus Kapabacteria bacterium]